MRTGWKRVLQMFPHCKELHVTLLHSFSPQKKQVYSPVRFCLFVCLFGFLTSSSTTRLYRGRAPRQERLTILRAATHETELGDHDFCLSRSHYTDTDPTCRERAATAGFEPGVTGYFGTGRIGTIPIYPGPGGRIFRNHSD